MPQRTICIQNKAKLSAEKSSLIIENYAGKARIPLEDVWVLIIESHEVAIDSSALARIVDAGIGVMTCDSRHMPNGLLLPLGAHSRHSAIVENQLSMPKPLRKQLWQRIVQSKIRNQAKTLDLLGLDGSDVRAESLAVLSDDRSGREGVAASRYFRKLISSGTRREGELTAPLDYGYAILRAGIARSAVAGGWLVSRGVHHCSDLNAFNLVDDLIEPFRPVVDLIVKEKIEGHPFDSWSKQTLVEVFAYYVIVEGKRYTVQAAINLMLDSFKRAVLGQDSSLIMLPEITELEICIGGE